MSMKKIAILPGDGIGPEVTAEARRVLEWFSAKRKLDLRLDEYAYGADAYRRLGQVLPKPTEEAIHAAHAILFGAMGGMDGDAIPRAARVAGGLPHVRRSLELFANLRPIVTIPALYESSSLKNRLLEGVDFVIVRELIGGIYFGQPRGIETLPNGERRGFNTQTYTTSEIRRIARFAFELARSRRRQVCSVDKANVMEAGVLWREEVQALRDAEFPDVELRHLYVDNCAMQLVRAPAQFDVVVTDNIFGDILSDCAAMAAGSLGMLPSASLGPVDAGRSPRCTVRTGARQRARHRRPRHRQSARSNSERRHDAAPVAGATGRRRAAGARRGRSAGRRRAHRRHLRAGPSPGFLQRNGRRGAAGARSSELRPAAVRLALAISSAMAQEAERASALSARLVSTIGTLAPTTTPASSASARYSSCLASMLPDSRSGTTRMSARPATAERMPLVLAATMDTALSNASGPSRMPPLIWPRSAILHSDAASMVARIFAVTVSTAARIATLGSGTPRIWARSIAFCTMSTLSSRVGSILIAASVMSSARG